MKVGILTFHFCDNFGAVLQCLGLHKAIESLGHRAEVIDYHPSALSPLPPWKGWGLRKKRPLLNIRKRYIELVKGSTMRKEFFVFKQKHLRFSEQCGDQSQLAQICQQYDAIIVGSDQVWNQSLRAVSPAYFLSLSPSFPGRKISYAACCGHSRQKTGSNAQIAAWLRQFYAHAVRNQFTQDWLYRLNGESARIVADPTLLLNYEPYEEQLVLPCDQFLLTYLLGAQEPDDQGEVVRALKRRYAGLPVVAICSPAHVPMPPPRWADYVLDAIGPGQWLGLVRKCSFIYTDSFHGAVFAIKNKLEFLAFYSEKERAERLIDLGVRYHVQQAICSRDQVLQRIRSTDSEIGWEATSNEMTRHAAESMGYLRQALN